MESASRHALSMKEIELSHEEGVEIRRRESRHDEPGHSGLTNFKICLYFQLSIRTTQDVRSGQIVRPKTAIACCRIQVFGVIAQ
jgi:hypothetical protein